MGQCSAKSKRTGERCRRHCAQGWQVCFYHGQGGGAPTGNTNALKWGVYTPGIKLQCNTCLITDTCPNFEKGKDCGFERGIEFDIKQIEECISAMNEVLKANWVSFQRGKRQEIAQGGIVDEGTLKIASRVSKDLEILGKFIAIRDQKVADVERTGVAVEVNVNSQVITPTLKEILEEADDDDRQQIIQRLRKAIDATRERISSS